MQQIFTKNDYALEKSFDSYKTCLKEILIKELQ